MTDDRTETIHDRAAIRDSDEPSGRGDFPCCSGARAAGGVDPKALANALTTAHALIEAKAQLESVRHLLQLRTDALARVTREADELRARLAAVEAVERGLSEGWVMLATVSDRAEFVRDLRAALATTGEGQ